MIHIIFYSYAVFVSPKKYLAFRSHAYLTIKIIEHNSITYIAQILSVHSEAPLAQ